MWQCYDRTHETKEKLQLVDLTDLDELKRACLDIKERVSAGECNPEWRNDLHEFLVDVRAADLQKRASQEFQQRIWANRQPVSSVGQGFVSVDAAIADAEFRNWLAERSMVQLPDAREGRDLAIQDFFDELAKRVRKYTNVTPWLKIYRVMAGFFPLEFTTMASEADAIKLHKELFGDPGRHGPSRHANILRRLDEVNGPVPTEYDIDAIVDRMRLPRLLFDCYVAPTKKENNGSPVQLNAEESLVPLPAARRTKGLTGITGGRNALLNILESCRDETTREDLKNHIQSVNPRLQDKSAFHVIYVLARELDCLKLDGDQVVLTDRGQAFLESDDPGQLMDWLITRILGVDHVLTILREENHCSRAELASRLQRVNPQWTTNRIPNVIIKELCEFEMLDREESGFLSLTNAGKEWALRIHWKPESLAPHQRPVDDDIEVPAEPETVSVSVPPFAQIHEKVSKHGHFPESVVRKLHYGLWTNERRHFAVLTGLSGSGKTLLARSYGKAIGGESGGSSRLSTVPVQPGWYDPSSLLGYVNPLQSNSYIRTPFLEFIITASENPEQPFTAVIDEMNLSRPEQYLAPILSAMETGEALTLHSEDESLDGVPSTVRYPNNLAIIGTVNMDETTHGISDKVLDRAFTIEFWDVDLTKYPSWGKRERVKEHEGKIRELLTGLMESLQPARLHFGWRVVDDVLDYIDRVIVDNADADVLAVLDDVVYAKILPKLRGDDSPRFREALKKTQETLRESGLNNCVLKVRELSDDLESTGSARFWR